MKYKRYAVFSRSKSSNDYVIERSFEQKIYANQLALNLKKIGRITKIKILR